MQLREEPAAGCKDADSIRINDFTLKIATVNGTGSSSANGMLMKSLFRMGLPVSGKNLFPSNIQGLPTWYEIRVNGKGFTARKEAIDIMIAMNAQTYADDVKELCPGGYFIYDSSWPLKEELKRDDLHYLGVPFADICIENFDGSRERILMKNITYVGALAAFVGMDREILNEQLRQQFGRKPALMDSNMKAIQLGYDAALEAHDCPINLQVKVQDALSNKIVIDGNTAAALGCIYAGATVAAWYPITPSTSVMDGFAAFASKYRVDEKTGKNNYAFIQAEDELAAIGMVIGAGWNGARAFTATSGPGISLMSEFIGFAYFTEIPAVIFDIQRAGPSTGMPTRTQQCDIMTCAYASHGDTKHILLFPADPKECFEMAVQAFDLAEHFQTPVFVVSDLDIGMNDWLIDELEWDDSYQPDRGQVLSAEELEKIENFYRYNDETGDGIASRTIPGTHPKGAYFTRGSGHNRYGAYTEDGDEYQEVMERLSLKINNAATAVPAPLVSDDGTDIAILTLGSCDAAAREAIAILAADGIKCDYLRVKGFPFCESVNDFISAHKTVFVVEQNRDAQLRSLLLIELAQDQDKLKSIVHYNGMPINAACIVSGVKEGIS